MTEVALVLLLLVRQLVPLAIFLGVGYHTGLVVLTHGSTFGMFWYALMGTYFALLAWPSAPVIVRYAPSNTVHSFAKRLVQRFDVEGWSRWSPGSDPPLEVQVGETVYVGIGAGARVLLYNPSAYFVFAVLCCLWKATIPLAFVLLAAIAYGELVRHRSALRVRVADTRP